MVGHFVEVCIRSVKFNAGKKQGDETEWREMYEVSVDRVQLEHVSELKYLGCFG